MSALPFPPPPEFGWYDDDTEEQEGLPHDSLPSSETRAWQAVSGQSAKRGGNPHGFAANGDVADRDGASRQEGVGHWDGTVLAGSFMSWSANRRYTLYNEATGQSLTMDHSILLGRKPSATVPDGVVSVRLMDPSRTVSRNHAAISFGRDGALWIEDFGSLNGTYVVRDNEEVQIQQGEPVKLTVPAVLQFGDQFVELSEAE